MVTWWYQKWINKTESSIIDFVKKTIIINNNNYEIVSEKILQKLILEDIESFMKELGDSFGFIGSEYKIRLGEQYICFYIILNLNVM